jgi:hypothetical protein
MPRRAHNRNDIDTLALAVQNRDELAECVATSEAGPLPAELMARVDQAVNIASGSRSPRHCAAPP